jgi:hypothetical protein
MKTRKLFLIMGVLIMSVSLSITGCRKDNTKEDDKDTSDAEDNVKADKYFEDLGQIANEASFGSVGSFKNGNNESMLSLCAKVTLDSTLRTFIVDFGTNNCLCADGSYRRGKVYISYTPGFHHLGYWDSLASHTITTAPTDNYFVDDAQVTGIKNVTNNGHNSAGHMNWSFIAKGQIVKANGSGTITWNSTRNREWIAGEKTLLWQDDVYSITGSADGTSAKGVSFNMSITSPLIRKMALACVKHFVSGTFDFTVGTKPVRHVDYGYSPAPNPRGSCDGWISVTIKGNTIYRQLP